MESSKQRISRDKLAKYKGTAQISIAHLDFPHPCRQVDRKVIKQLKRDFEAIIDDPTLQAGLEKLATSVDAFKAASKDDPPKLHLARDTLVDQNLLERGDANAGETLASSYYCRKGSKWESRQRTSSPASSALKIAFGQPRRSLQHLDKHQSTGISSTNPQKRLLDAPFEDFASSLLPLYPGPQVTIRIGSASHEYTLPKALLCKQSPYFAAAFEGNFKEGDDQSITLEEIDGVVSTRSFQMLSQWLCLGRVVFDELTPEESITAAIEFARLADMCSVTGMESLMSGHIKKVIISSAPPPPPKGLTETRDLDTNTHCLISQHIISVESLPAGHPVRGLLAAAVIEGYFCSDDFKFSKEAELPNFSIDLLKIIKATLKTLTNNQGGIAFKDPFSGEMLGLERVPDIYF
ncbi:uncharacterized protein PAC_15923 [Phialocephala subalpina]|uniref:BTB domain-containing protein n=1 Tax=Phialocephala subalpina TaxID=576137 RepID=A0A1L7XLY0_9HELO|nr:uncharacterized protein PAC_15923 [Phialocephala subalpina]